MTTQTLTNPTQREIEAANRAFEAAMRAGDAAAITRNYSESARILPPGTPLLTGKAAIQAYWQEVIDMGITELNLEALDLEVLDDTAWEVGQAVMKAGAEVVDRVKYLIIWKEDVDRWVKHRGTWNSNGS